MSRPGGCEVRLAGSIVGSCVELLIGTPGGTTLSRSTSGTTVARGTSNGSGAVAANDSRGPPPIACLGGERKSIVLTGGMIRRLPRRKTDLGGLLGELDEVLARSTAVRATLEKEEARARCQRDVPGTAERTRALDERTRAALTNDETTPS